MKSAVFLLFTIESKRAGLSPETVSSTGLPDVHAVMARAAAATPINAGLNGFILNIVFSYYFMYFAFMGVKLPLIILPTKSFDTFLLAKVFF